MVLETTVLPLNYAPIKLFVYVVASTKVIIAKMGGQRKWFFDICGNKEPYYKIDVPKTNNDIFQNKI